MGRFEFTRTKKTFIWANNDIKLVFSEPSFQAFDDYALVSDIRGAIMYFYYTVSIYKRIFVDCVEYEDGTDEDIYKWKLVTERHTHDFPTILQLDYWLDLLLNKNEDIIACGQKHVYRDGSVEYSRTFCTEGFACDDFYEITKYVDIGTNKSHYVLYMGTTFDSQGDLNSVGIRTPYLNEDDVKELYACVCAFLEYTRVSHNNLVKQRNKMYSSCFFIKNNTLYSYEKDYRRGVVLKDRISHVYKKGDTIDSITYLSYDDDKNYHSDNLRKAVIEDISDDSILLSNALLSNGMRICIKDIVHFSNDVSKEALKYGVNEIADEFISAMDDDLKKEFREFSLDTLLDKYNMAIINRTWMCREEHGFDINFESGNRVKDVQPVVKEVINRIKTIL